MKTLSRVILCLLLVASSYAQSLQNDNPPHPTRKGGTAIYDVVVSGGYFVTDSLAKLRSDCAKLRDSLAALKNNTSGSVSVALDSIAHVNARLIAALADSSRGLRARDTALINPVVRNAQKALDSAAQVRSSLAAETASRVALQASVNSQLSTLNSTENLHTDSLASHKNQLATVVGSVSTLNQSTASSIQSEVATRNSADQTLNLSVQWIMSYVNTTLKDSLALHRSQINGLLTGTTPSVPPTDNGGTPVVVTEFTTPIYTGKIYAAANGSAGNAGTFVSPWDLATAITHWNSTNDTLVLRGGNYTSNIVPLYSGASATKPLVLTNYGAEVCSLFVATTPLYIENLNNITIRGVRARMSYAQAPVVYVTSASHITIYNCRFYGGGSNNNVAYANWFGCQFNDVQYLLFAKNLYDRMDVAINNENYRGDGLGLTGNSSLYNIFDTDTVVNVSHYGICVPYGVHPLTSDTYSYAIVRNCIVHDCHVGLGSVEYNQGVLFEGNRIWSPGQAFNVRGGLAYEGTTANSCIRFNSFADDSVELSHVGNVEEAVEMTSQNYYGMDWNNRIYHNLFMSKSRNAYRRNVVGVRDYYNGGTKIGAHVFINNILAYPTTGSYGSVVYLSMTNTNANTRDTLRKNLVYNNGPGGTIAEYVNLSYNTVASYTLAQAKSALPSFWESTNFEATPKWVDSLSLRGNRNGQLAAGSPCLDAAIGLTQVTVPVSNSTTIHVRDPHYFHYAWGGHPYDRGDSIRVGGILAEITSADYVNNTITVRDPITVNSGVDIFIEATYSSVSGYTRRFYGSAPDIGPYENVQ